jgi:hypothetical protein
VKKETSPVAKVKRLLEEQEGHEGGAKKLPEVREEPEQAEGLAGKNRGSTSNRN